MRLLRIRSVTHSCVRKIYVSITTNQKNLGLDEFTSAVKTAGYRCECYKVKTEDGYILTTHRMLPKQHSVHQGSCFLMHGLFRNSTDYIASGPKTALAYFLADNGYDVWLGNARGTKHCIEHVKYSCASKEFWKFSFHDIGLYDVSANLDFVLNHTKEAHTTFIGHSQGASALMVLLSSKPKYNEKVSQAHLMTPAVFMKNSTSPLLTSPLLRSKLFQKSADSISRLDISLFLKLSHALCNFDGFNLSMAMRIYKNLTCSLVGQNKEGDEISEEALRTMQTFTSPYVSMMQLTHFLQLHLSGKFQKYDYGSKNLLHYESSHPPEYKLHKVSSPVYLYSASQDTLIRSEDVDHMRDVLPSAVKHEIFNGLNHMDVMLGRHSRNILYPNILNSMKANR